MTFPKLIVKSILKRHVPFVEIWFSQGKFSSILVVSPSPFFKKNCSNVSSDDTPFLRCSGSITGRLARRNATFWKSVFFLRLPIDDGKRHFHSHTSTSDSHSFSGTMDFAGVLPSLHLKSNGPHKYELGSNRFMLSLYLPYLLRSGLARGDSKIFLPKSNSLPDSFQISSLHSGHQRLRLPVFASTDGWRCRNSQKYVLVSAVSRLFSMLTWIKNHLRRRVPTGAYWMKNK